MNGCSALCGCAAVGKYAMDFANNLKIVFSRVVDEEAIYIIMYIVPAD
jgi:hypothetical protein